MHNAFWIWANFPLVCLQTFPPNHVFVMIVFVGLFGLFQCRYWIREGKRYQWKMSSVSFKERLKVYSLTSTYSSVYRSNSRK